MAKERTLNELRQVKDSVYTPPKIVNDFYREVNFDPKYIVELIKEFPNNQELGSEVRKYFLEMKNKTNV